MVTLPLPSNVSLSFLFFVSLLIPFLMKNVINYDNKYNIKFNILNIFMCTLVLGSLSLSLLLSLSCNQSHLLYFICCCVQLPSCVQIFATPWTAAGQAPLSSTSSQSLFRFRSLESVTLSKYLILCQPFSFCLQSFPASGSFPMSWLFASGSQKLELQLQHQSFQ